MKSYISLGERILKEGYCELDTRTGKKTYSLFGVMERFDISGGKIPLLTTKKVNPLQPIREALWMLSGSTNAEELNAMGCPIWNQWGLPEDVIEETTLTVYERALIYQKKNNLTLAQLNNALGQSLVEVEEALSRGGIEKTKKTVTRRKGDLGPVYGEQMVAWPRLDGTTLNQIQSVIDGLIREPRSRHNLVLNFNPGVKPDVTVAPQENVLAGRQALAACHVLFQFYTKLIPLDALEATLRQNHPEVAERYFALTQYWGATDEAVTHNKTLWLEVSGVPIRSISCLFYMRSNDVPVGLPFNLMGYAAITGMVAQQVNMVPDELIYAAGDVHVYEDQLDDFKVQLSREPKASPTMTIRKAKDIFSYTEADFTFDNYEHHDYISYKVAL